MKQVFVLEDDEESYRTAIDCRVVGSHTETFRELALPSLAIHRNVLVSLENVVHEQGGGLGGGGGRG